MSYNVANEFVINFLKTNVDEKMLDEWNKIEKVFKKKFSNLKSKIKNKNRPIKNKSAYAFFILLEREIIKSENSSITNNEIMIEIGIRWKKIKNNKTEVEKYEILSQNDKKRYEQDFKNGVVKVFKQKEKNISSKRRVFTIFNTCCSFRNSINNIKYNTFTHIKAS